MRCYNQEHLLDTGHLDHERPIFTAVTINLFFPTALGALICLFFCYLCPGLQMSRKAYFNGDSYIASSQKVSFFHGFEGGFNFRTLQPNGLLFYSAEGVSIILNLKCYLFGNMMNQRFVLFF